MEQTAKSGIPRIKKTSKINARGQELYFAKVGVEGSNPFARSRFSQENQEVESGPSGPFLLRRPR
jgi:hypothetical protein